MENSSAILVRLPEHVDQHEACALASEIDRRLLDDQPCIVVDFSKVKQIDSAGLDLILNCMVKVARQDGAVQLGDVSPEAATMLEITRLDGMFELFPRIAENTVTLPFVPRQSPEFAEEDADEQEVRTAEPQPLAA